MPTPPIPAELSNTWLPVTVTALETGQVIPDPLLRVADTPSTTARATPNSSTPSWLSATVTLRTAKSVPELSTIASWNCATVPFVTVTFDTCGAFTIPRPPPLPSTRCPARSSVTPLARIAMPLPGQFRRSLSSVVSPVIASPQPTCVAYAGGAHCATDTSTSKTASVTLTTYIV